MSTEYVYHKCCNRQLTLIVSPQVEGAEANAAYCQFLRG